MPITRPLKCARQIIDTGTTGTTSYPFFLQENTEGIVVRAYALTFTGTSPTCDIYVQTTPDGGTTWYDCGHFSQITATGQLINAMYMPIASVPSVGGGSDSTTWIGSVAASTMGSARMSGLPLLGTYNRIQIVYGGTIGSNTGVTIDVLVNSQDNAV